MGQLESGVSRQEGRMSALKLEKKYVSWTIGHCKEWGDTDIFPRPFEYQWFFDARDEIAQTISALDLNVSG